MRAGSVQRLAAPCDVAAARSVDVITSRGDSGRIAGVDAGRALAIWAVVLIHCVTPTPRMFGIDAAAILDQLCRWAVPFFFVASGYLYGRRAGNERSAAIAMLTRLVPIFLAWSLLYALLSRGGLAQLLEPEITYRWLAAGGPGWHLWFLPSLALCLLIVLLLRGVGTATPAMVAIALGLYALGLGLGSYHPLLVGHAFDPASTVDPLPILNGRGGPFPLIFVVIGYGLATNTVRLRLRVGIVLLIAGACLHLSEALYLDAYGWMPFVHHDLLIGTLAFGTGAFVVILRLPTNALTRPLARLGTYSLGIYAVHVIFLITLRRLLQPAGLPASLGLALLVLAASTVTVVVLCRTRALRPILR